MNLKKLPIIKFWFPPVKEIRVLVREGNDFDVVPGIIKTRLGEGALVSYRHSDGTGQSFAIKSLGELTFRGIPMIPNRVGDALNFVGEPGMGTDYLDAIVASNIGPKLCDAMEEYSKEGQGLPWRKIIIGCAIAFAVIIAWRQGFIQSVITDIFPRG